MTKFLQVLSIILLMQWLANGTPLFQGISFQRGFELNFKPLPRKPITFLKEKWSPFGVFGRKHSLQKRHSGSGEGIIQQPPVVSPAPVVAPLSGVPEPQPAPVFEHVEYSGNLQAAPLIPVPHQSPRSVVPLLITSPPPVSPIQPPLLSPRPPSISSPVSPPVPVIVSPVPPVPPVFSNVPPPSITPQLVGIPAQQPITSNVQQPPHLRLEGGLPDLSSNMVVPQPSGLYTDVSRAEPVREFVNAVQVAQPIPPPLAVEEKVTPPLETNTIKPEPPKNDMVINDNALVRGSKFALYFGSIFLQLVSQFMTNARATFDQMTNGTPVYNN